MILPGGAVAGNYEIMASQMRLRADLLHEGELLALLDDIRKSVRAMIQVRSCSMERIAQASADRPGPAQIRVECALEWITLRERK